MNLLQWHNKFATHFSDLHKQRITGNFSLFAFEHGLRSEELIQLKNAIQNQLEVSSPNPDYWLPWVVYAAEIGYEFDGHEFWQSFTEKTPKWTLHGNRYFIRNCFEKFVQSFGGFKPSGIWADHFNIICYPITHAILPKDLQRQLARILYDLRFQFNRSFLQSTEQLGNKILSRSEGATKRFQQFSQNIELTGLIARELLSHDQNESENIILPATLRRIVGDLRKEGDASSWLDEARTIARDRVNRTTKVRTEGDKAHRIKLEPTLILRPTGGMTWDLYVEIPDLLPLAEQSTELFEFLTTSRPRINGSFFDKRLARSRLVSHGSIQEKLKSLPDKAQDLLIFRREKPSALDQFLKNEFRLKTQEINLFKIHNDGLAYKQKSASVIPGSSYLILARQIISNNSLVAKQHLSCDSVYLYSLVLPKTISSSEESFLTSLGFSVKQGINIIPVGTTPATWDEESYIEFLADESPCIAIEFDHVYQSLLLEYGDELNELQNPDSARPVIINLPQFPVGSYKFTVSGKKLHQSQYEILGNAEINIREPRTRQAATTNQNALLLFTDPFRPTFEQLFAGKVRFDFWTPPDTKVDFYLTLLDKNSEHDRPFRKKLCELTLPDESGKINSNIFEALQDKQILSRSEDAHACFLEFETGEFGTVQINFEREFLPLKWIVRADNKNQIYLKLSDYSDSGEIVSVVKYDFDFPDQRKTVPYSEVHELGFPIPEGGGLYIAQTSQIKQGIIILRRMAQSSFKSFTEIKQNDGFKPVFLKHARNTQTLSALIKLYTLWTTSASAGSAFKKSDINVVSNALLLEIVSLIDNNHGWKKAETQYCSGKVGSDFYLHKAVSSKPSLLEKLSKVCESRHWYSVDEWVDRLVFALGDEIPEERTKVHKIGKISHIKVTSRDWFAEFALRLCSRPDTLQEWADKRYELGLEKMLLYPTIARAARYIVLRLNKEKRIFYNWDWE